MDTFIITAIVDAVNDAKKVAWPTYFMVTIRIRLLESSCDAVGSSRAREEQSSYQPSH